MKSILKVIGNIMDQLLGNKNVKDKFTLLKCEKLYLALQLMVTLPVYVRDSIGRKNTYCNISAYDLLDSRCRVAWNVNVKVGEDLKVKYPMGKVMKVYDYDLSKVLPEDKIDKILAAPISYVFDECLKEAKIGNVKIITQAEAQEKANKGIPIMIISKEYNHVAIACPNLKWNDSIGRMEIHTYNEALGCFTGNCGWENDLMYMSDTRGFGGLDWKNEDKIKYVQFKTCNGVYEE